MSRPKGSKNKVQEEAPKVESPVAKQVGHSIVFDPKPDMGNIKPPSKGKLVCQCSHEKDFHYGGQYGQCNRPGCTCLRFQ